MSISQNLRNCACRAFLRSRLDQARTGGPLGSPTGIASGFIQAALALVWRRNISLSLAIALLGFVSIVGSAEASPSLRSVGDEWGFEPQQIRISCLNTGSIELMGPATAVGSLKLEIDYDPRVIMLEDLRIGSSEKLDSHSVSQLSMIESFRVHDAEGRASARLNLQSDGQANSGTLSPRISLSVIGLVSGRTNLRIKSARLNDTVLVPNLDAGEIDVQVTVTCAGMTPVPALDRMSAKDELSTSSVDEADDLESPSSEAELANPGDESESISENQAEPGADSDALALAMAPSPPAAFPVTGKMRTSYSACQIRLMPGETVYASARRHEVNPLELGRLNGGVDLSMLRAGLMLRLPDCAKR